MLKSDTAGPVYEATIKLSNYGVTWNTRLEKLIKNPGKVTICTYSLSDISFISRLLRKCEAEVTIIANSAYGSLAQRFQDWYPYVNFYVTPYAHGKVALAEPNLVYISSENLGHHMNSFDASIGIENDEVYAHYLKQVEKLLNNRAAVKLEAHNQEGDIEDEGSCDCIRRQLYVEEMVEQDDNMD